MKPWSIRAVRSAGRRRCPSAAAAALLCLLPVAAQAQRAATAPSVPAREARAAAQARALATALVEEAALPGLSIAVGVGDDVVWSDGIGWADVETRTPVSPLSRFRIGSVSKTLTSDALLSLWEHGRLDLDSPVQRYVPDFPKKRWSFTTRQLAGHLAGIRHYRDAEFLLDRHFDTVKQGLSIFENDTLLFRPGTRYSYSTYGWNLISAVMESASGQDFLDLMRRTVFEPLRMTHTVPDFNDTIIPYRVSFYVKDSTGLLLNAPEVDNSYKWAGGGFLSTPGDLVRFGLSHVNGSPVLADSAIALLWRSQRLDSGAETGYGMGWFTQEDPYGRHVVGHTGGSVGGTTAFLLLPDQRTCVAITVNLSAAPGLWNLARTVAEFFAPPATLAAASGPSTDGATNGADNGTAASPVTGRFAFRTSPDARGRAVSGTLELVAGRDGGYTGWISSDVVPLARVAVVEARDGVTRVAAAAGAGIIDLWLRLDGQNLTGRWAGPGGDGALTGHRLGE